MPETPVDTPARVRQLGTSGHGSPGLGFGECTFSNSFGVSRFPGLTVQQLDLQRSPERRHHAHGHNSHQPLPRFNRWRAATDGCMRCTPRCRSYKPMMEPICHGPSRRGTASICVGRSSSRKGSPCQMISVPLQGPVARMCLMLQSQLGPRIGSQPERRFACRKDRAARVPSGVDA